MHALRPDETLLVMAGDDPQFTAPVKGAGHRLGLSSIARLVAEKSDSSAKELARRIRFQFSSSKIHTNRDRTLLVVKRRRPDWS